MFTVKFWKDAAERAVKSVAQALLLYGGGDLFANAWTVDVSAAGWISVAAGGLSLLTSLASLRAGESGTASAVKS